MPSLVYKEKHFARANSHLRGTQHETKYNQQESGLQGNGLEILQLGKEHEAERKSYSTGETLMEVASMRHNTTNRW